MTQLSKQEAAGYIADLSLSVSTIIGKNQGFRLSQDGSTLATEVAVLLRNMFEHEELELSSSDWEGWVSIIAVWHDWPARASRQLGDICSAMIGYGAEAEDGQEIVGFPGNGLELCLSAASILEDLIGWSDNREGVKEPTFTELDFVRDFLLAMHNATSYEFITESS